MPYKIMALKREPIKEPVSNEVYGTPVEAETEFRRLRSLNPTIVYSIEECDEPNPIPNFQETLMNEKGGKKLEYVINVWIPAELEEPAIFPTMDEAQKELEQLRLLCPENIYQITEREEGDP